MTNAIFVRLNMIPCHT